MNFTTKIILRPFAKYASCIALFSLITTSVLSQSSNTFGNVFIHSEGNMTEFSINEFNIRNRKSQPGIIGGERIPTKGYYNFADGAGWRNADDFMFVDGYVRFFGNAPFLFPIGDNNKFRPAAVSGGSYVEAAYYGTDPTSAVTSDIRGGNFPVLPQTGPFPSVTKEETLLQVSEWEYWDINGNDPTILTLTWNEESNIDIITNNKLERLVIVGWDGQMWVEIPSQTDLRMVDTGDYSSNFSGNTPTLIEGSISTTTTVVPSEFEVYTLAASCGELMIEADRSAVVCLGEEMTLEAITDEDATLTWSIGEVGESINISPTETTTYTVVATLGGCEISHEIFVDVRDVFVDLGQDTFICRGQDLVLTPADASNNSTFQWDDGNTIQFGEEITINTNQPKDIFITITDNSYGCKATDQIFVDVRDAPDVDTGRDRKACRGDTVFIQATGSTTGMGYRWSTGDTMNIIWVSPLETTVYEVSLTENGCTDIGYATVEIFPEAYVEIVSDTLICEGQPVTIETEGTEGRYNWSNGELGESITVTPTDGETYSVTITSDGNCNWEDEITFSSFEGASLGDDKSVCVGQEVELTLEGVYDSVLWEDSSTNDTYMVTPTQTTTYSVTTTFNGCEGVDEITINVSDNLSVDLGDDVSVCNGELVQLSTNAIGTYLWSNGQRTPSIFVSPNESTTYSVTVTSGTCSDSDEVTVNIVNDCMIDLSLDKSANDKAPFTGDTISFIIVVSNETNAVDATNVVVREELQSGFEFISYEASQGTYDPNTALWIIGEVSAGTSDTLSIDVKVLEDGLYTNTAEVIAADQEDVDSEPDNELDEDDKSTIKLDVTENPLGNDDRSEIGDRVWHDIDGDGIQEINEAGMEGVVVELYSVSQGGILVDTKITDHNGYYCFTTLRSGEYYVKFQKPEGMLLTLPDVLGGGGGSLDFEDSDVTHSNGEGTTDVISLGIDERIKTIDAGYHIPSRIGDLVWVDVGEGGIPGRYDDMIDSGIEGVVMRLLDEAGNILAETATDSRGYYSFENLRPGIYIVEIETPLGHGLVAPNVATENLDSDFSAASFRTQLIFLGAEVDKDDVDAGLQPTLPITLHDFWGERIHDDHFNRLFWTTESEFNTHVFIIERSLNTTGNWEAAGEVEAAGSSSSRLYYSFDDLDSREAALYYYRLRTRDLDGSEAISKIITIEVLEEDAGKKEFEIDYDYKVFPIPTSDFLTLEIDSPNEAEFQGNLINNLGQNVRKISVEYLDQGINQIELNVRDLPQGEYYLNFYISKKQYIARILKLDR